MQITASATSDSTSTIRTASGRVRPRSASAFRSRWPGTTASCRFRRPERGLQPRLPAHRPLDDSRSRRAWRASAPTACCWPSRGSTTWIREYERLIAEKVEITAPIETEEIGRACFQSPRMLRQWYHPGSSMGSRAPRSRRRVSVADDTVHCSGGLQQYRATVRLAQRVTRLGCRRPSTGRWHPVGRRPGGWPRNPTMLVLAPPQVLLDLRVWLGDDSPSIRFATDEHQRT